MRRRDNIKLVVVAALCMVVGATAPAVGHGVQHAIFAHSAKKADMVDGKHAVGAGATTQERARRLVATDGSGLLPNDIISKALDADRLDGKDATDFLGAGDKATDADRLDGRDLHQVASHWLSVRASADLWGNSAGLAGTTVTRPSGNPVGVYCIVLPGGINAEGAVGSVQQNLGGNGLVSFITVTTFFGNACNSVGHWDIAVQTYDSTGAPADRPFNVLIPALGF